MDTNFTNDNREKRTINLVKANIYSLILIPFFVVLYFVPYYLIWKNDFSNFDFTKIVSKGYILFVIIIIGIILHELIHGITFAFFAKKGFKSIKFGVLWKSLTPYCHCKEPLLRNHYMLGVIMPFVILGLIPAIVGIATNDLNILILGTFFSIVACGDFLIINLLRKEDSKSWIEDHPTEAGYFVYKK